MNDPSLDSIRKRILLFYFAGGVNLFMRAANGSVSQRSDGRCSTAASPKTLSDVPSSR